MDAVTKHDEAVQAQIDSITVNMTKKTEDIAAIDAEIATLIAFIDRPVVASMKVDLEKKKVKLENNLETMRKNKERLTGQLSANKHAQCNQFVITLLSPPYGLCPTGKAKILSSCEISETFRNKVTSIINDQTMPIEIKKTLIVKLCAGL